MRKKEKKVMANFGMHGKDIHSSEKSKATSSWADTTERAATSRRGSIRVQDRPRDEQGRFVSTGKSRSMTSNRGTFGETANRGAATSRGMGGSQRAGTGIYGVGSTYGAGYG
jgi:hypothetical protein